MQKETGINKQMNNYILNPYNLLTRGLRLSTKWKFRHVLTNKERKTDIKRRRRRDTEGHRNFRRHFKETHCMRSTQ